MRILVFVEKERFELRGRHDIYDIAQNLAADRMEWQNMVSLTSDYQLQIVL